MKINYRVLLYRPNEFRHPSGALDQRSFREHMSTRFEDEICVTTTMTNLDRRHRMPHDVRSSLAT